MANYGLGLLLIFCWASRVQAQEPIPDFSYHKLLRLAKQEHKWLYLSVNQDDSVRLSDTMDGEGWVTRWNDFFVVGSINVADGDIGHPLRMQYDFSRLFRLVLDQDGFPLWRSDRVDEVIPSTLLMDSIARIAAGETMGKLWQEYQRGLRDRRSLKSLLRIYQTFDMYTDQRILASYLSSLTVEELDNFETVVFLLECGPVYDSKNYRLALINNHLVDSVFRTLPLAARMNINGRMIRNTYRTAFTNRDHSMIWNLANYSRSAWESHYIRGELGGDFYSMHYYRLTADTANYLDAARWYYNRYYMDLGIDSLACVDYAAHAGKEITRGAPTLDSLEEVTFQTWFAESKANYALHYAHELYAAAYQFSRFAVRDK